MPSLLNINVLQKANHPIMQIEKKIEELVDSLKDYATTNFELVKLEAIERSAVIGGSICTMVAIGLVGTFFLVFGSLCIGFYLSAQLGNYYVGFGLVAAFYLLMMIVLFVFSSSLIEKPIRNMLIKKKWSISHNKQPANHDTNTP